MQRSKLKSSRSVRASQVLLVFAWQADKIYQSGIEFDLFGLSPLKRLELKTHMEGGGLLAVLLGSVDLFSPVLLIKGLFRLLALFDVMNPGHFLLRIARHQHGGMLVFVRSNAAYF